MLAELSTRLAEQGFTTVTVVARSYASQAPYSLVADIVRALQAAAEGETAKRPLGDGATTTRPNSMRPRWPTCWAMAIRSRPGAR